MKKIVTLLALAVLIGGCAINSGIVSSGQDVFMITRQAPTCFEGSGRIKNLAFQDGKQFCSNQGKYFHVISIGGHHPPYIGPNFPRVEVKFMCLDANDPRLKAEEMGNLQQPIQGIKTEGDDNCALETKLKTLNKLLSDGMITKNEFEEQKKKLLNDYTHK